MNKLLIVDLKNIIYRCFHSPTLKDVNNAGIVGFINIIRFIFIKLKPTHIIIANDSPKNYRKDTFNLYKSNRKPPEEELVRQLNLMPIVCESLGFPFLEIYGYESDDIFGTISHLCDLEENYICFILSNDKDAKQCLSDSTLVIDSVTQDGEISFFTQEMVFDKYGVRNYQFVDYLAICGDSADFYKGARKVGAKGACELLAEFDTLEGIFQNIDKIKKNVYRESFINNEAEIRQSKELAQIVKTVPINKNLEDFRYRKPDREKSYELFTRLGMNELAERFK